MTGRDASRKTSIDRCHDGAKLEPAGTHIAAGERLIFRRSGVQLIFDCCDSSKSLATHEPGVCGHTHQ
jgi:hypothetical protein